MNELAFELPAGLSAIEFVAVLTVFALSGVMSGLSGFGFSAMGAISLVFLPPKLAVPLLMALSIASQSLSLGSIRKDLKPFNEWFPQGPGLYLVGGFLGAPLGIWLLQSLSTNMLMLGFGNFLVIYALYSLRNKTQFLQNAPVWVPIAVGFIGGVIGGFTAFPGAALVIWVTLRGMQKADTRAVVQPFILSMQLLSISILAARHPETFSADFWLLLMITLPVVLPCTLLGARAYRRVSDINFRKIVLVLLGSSGAGVAIKGATAMKLLGAIPI